MNTVPAFAPALRKHLRHHNWSVLAGSGFTFLLVSVLWSGIYFFCYWMFLLKTTVLDPHVRDIPPGFLKGYLLVVAGLIVVAWLDRKFFPDDRAREERSFLELTFNIIMCLPNLTVLMVENLGALVRYSRHEFEEATGLMDELKHSRRIAIHELPRMIQNDRQLERVLFGLRVSQLVDARREDGVFWLHVSSLAPEIFRPVPEQTPVAPPPREPPLPKFKVIPSISYKADVHALLNPPD